MELRDAWRGRGVLRDGDPSPVRRRVIHPRFDVRNGAIGIIPDELMILGTKPVQS